MRSIVEVRELETAQEADANSIEATVAKAESEIAALDARRLPPEELRRRRQEICDAAISAVRDTRQHALERTKEADMMRKAFEPEAYRRAVLTKQAATVAPLVTVLGTVPTPALLAYLVDAVSAKNVAVAEAVRLVFQDRPDRVDHVETFAATFAKIEMPEVDEARERLARVRAKGAHIDVRITELLRGRTNGIARLDALRRGRAA